MGPAEEQPDPSAEAEVIRHQVEETRSDLAEKLGQLENQVVDMIQGTTGSVAETLENVKESVEHTVEAVEAAVQGTVKSVRHAFNLHRHVQKHPWRMLGVAIAIGFVCGQFIYRG
jgi:ElaB/YqjD/DUF883 family membrane-anchored ribosome-binding protein